MDALQGSRVPASVWSASFVSETLNGFRMNVISGGKFHAGPYQHTKEMGHNVIFNVRSTSFIGTFCDLT